MHFPVTLDVGGVSIPAHTILEALAYVVGFRVYLAVRARAGDVVDRTVRWSVIAAAAVGAAVGSKILFWLDDPAGTWAHRGEPEWLLGGKTIVGAILGGWAAVEGMKAILGERRRTGDVFAAGLCAGIAVGRTGCFLTGLADRTYGTATSLPWGVDFGDGVPRHPTQLYEALLFAVLAVPFARAAIRPHAEGAVFRAFVAVYLAWRLGIDFLKPGPSLAGLSGIQWACVAGLGVVAWTWRPRSGSRGTAELAAEGARG